MPYEPDGVWRIELTYLLREGDGYIVGIDPEGDVDWQVKDALAIELKKQPLEWGRVQHQVSQLCHAEVEHLSERQVAQPGERSATLWCWRSSFALHLGRRARRRREVARREAT